VVNAIVGHQGQLGKSAHQANLTLSN
jgi:hypothetical protein